MPAPPPPPPLMGPAAPPPPVFKAPKGGADDRGALLKSIRQGAKLKKTVTNDKSAPIIQGAAKPTSSPSQKMNNNFTPGKNFSSIQDELRKQLASDNRNRGPPPPAPNRSVVENTNGQRRENTNGQRRENTNGQRQPFSPKENVSNGLHLSQLALNINSSSVLANRSTLHRKAKSNANLNSYDNTDESNNGFQPPKLVVSHGKPNLAPKPPTLLIDKNTSQKKNGKPVSRAHSMKSPRSPSPQSPDSNPPNKFRTVRHISSIINQSLSSSEHTPRSKLSLNSRPTVPPPCVPSQPPPVLSPLQNQTPPTPLKVNSVKHPNHAPPPPPGLLQSQLPAPPLPPHKTQSIRQPPLVPPSNAVSAPPPPPPPRHSSMRDGPTTKKVFVDLDEKFRDLFQTMDKFPQPPAYKNVFKIYSNKQGQHIKTDLYI